MSQQNKFINWDANHSFGNGHFTTALFKTIWLCKLSVNTFSIIQKNGKNNCLLLPLTPTHFLGTVRGPLLYPAALVSHSFVATCHMGGSLDNSVRQAFERNIGQVLDTAAAALRTAVVLQPDLQTISVAERQMAYYSASDIDVKVLQEQIRRMINLLAVDERDDGWTYDEQECYFLLNLAVANYALAIVRLERMISDRIVTIPQRDMSKLSAGLSGP